MMDIAKNEKRYNLFTDKNSSLRRKVNKNTSVGFLSLIFRFVLFLGLSFVILFPFIVKLSSMFMSVKDTYDTTVAFIPRNPTFENIKYILTNEQLMFPTAFLNTVLMSLMVGVCSVIMAATVGYGLAKFKFKGVKIVTVLVVLTLLIPPQTIMIPMYTNFRYFLGGLIKLTDTPVPMLFLSLTGFGFRSGLYIIIMRQIFAGIPKELSEAAAVDGVGVFKTFYYVMLPNARAMLFTVFLFSFCWQWTDTYYTGILYSKLKLLPYIVTILRSANITDLGTGAYTRDILVNTLVVMVIVPLLILFILVQKKFVQGIESSGIVG